MKMYIKPSIEVIELQLKEDIAAVPTTVYKGRENKTPASGYSLKNATSAGFNAAELNEKLENYGITVS